MYHFGKPLNQTKDKETKPNILLDFEADHRRRTNNLIYRHQIFYDRQEALYLLHFWLFHSIGWKAKHESCP